MSKSNDQTYMFVVKGHVQRIPAKRDGVEVLVWPVAHNHKDAMRLCRWMSKRYKNKSVRPALIGSLNGETLEGHLELAINEGCVAVVTPMRYDDNGNPVWGFIDMDMEGGES